MKNLYWKLGIFLLLLLPFGLGLFGGCGSCIPEILLPKVILIDDVHQNENDFDGYSINSFYEKMISTLQEMGYTVKFASQAGFNPSLLTYSTVLLPAPFQAYTSGEIQTLVGFVNSGGKIIMFGEWSGYGDTANANLSILSTTLGAGIVFDSNTVYDDSSNYNNTNYWPLISDFANHPTTTGLSEITLIAGTSLTTQSPAIPIAYASSTAYKQASFSRGENSVGAGIEPVGNRLKVGSIVAAAVSQVGRGKVIAVGDVNLFSNDIYFGGTDFIDLYSNKQFLKNIINWW